MQVLFLSCICHFLGKHLEVFLFFFFLMKVVPDFYSLKPWGAQLGFVVVSDVPGCRSRLPFLFLLLKSN